MKNTTSNWFFLEQQEARHKKNDKRTDEPTTSLRMRTRLKGSRDGRWTFLLQFPSSEGKIPIAKPIPVHPVISEKFYRFEGRMEMDGELELVNWRARRPHDLSISHRNVTARTGEP